MKNIDYYKILDLSRDATEDEIKKAFRNLAFKYHPDKNSGDAVSEKKFKEINNAYTVLSNSETRRRYDLFGHNDFNSQLYNENPSNFRGGNPFNPRSNFGCGRGMGRGMGCGKRSRFNSWNSFAFAEPEKSLSDDDLIFKIDITEEEAVSGTKKIIFAQTSSGKIKILFNIRPGTLDGTKIKLSTDDKIPELNDLYIRVSISN